jgi:hypothetical protein
VRQNDDVADGVSFGRLVAHGQAMIPRHSHRRQHLILLAGLISLASCATQPVPKAVPAPPSVANAGLAEAPRAAADWRDGPLTEGTWRYVPGDAVSSARFGRDGATAVLIVRCDRASHQIALLRDGMATELSIMTSAGVERRAAGRIDEASVPMTGILFTANDALLDRIVFSRGRFAIGAPGLPVIVAPAWAEPARSIQDCRK